MASAGATMRPMRVAVVALALALVGCIRTSETHYTGDTPQWIHGECDVDRAPWAGACQAHDRVTEYRDSQGRVTRSGATTTICGSSFADAAIGAEIHRRRCKGEPSSAVTLSTTEIITALTAP